MLRARAGVIRCGASRQGWPEGTPGIDFAAASDGVFHLRRTDKIMIVSAALFVSAEKSEFQQRVCCLRCRTSSKEFKTSRIC